MFALQSNHRRMNPYIDKSNNEQNQPEYSIHGLKPHEIRYILAGLDKLSMDTDFVNRKAVLELAEGLYQSAEKYDY